MKYVLLLSNVRPIDANTIHDHQAALVNREDAFVFVLNPLQNPEVSIDFSRFDVIIIHYTLCCFLDNYINPGYRRAIRDFRGLKVIFIQDEYRFIYSAIDAMIGLGIDVLFTMVPKDEIEAVYGQLLRRGGRIEPTLAGYVPDNLRELPRRPLEERPLDVVYRGRVVPFTLGRLGTEKVYISRKFQQIAPSYGLKVDLDYREEARIYGLAWPEFLSSGRASLGTESGASISDFTGELDEAVRHYVQENPTADYEDLYRDFLHAYEGNLLMNVVSPRVFEAMALDTALVQFPGGYSGVLSPHQHYIPLAKDFANIDEVVDAIRDIGFLKKLVARAREDIILSGRYSFRTFADGVFEVIREEWERRVYRHPSVPPKLLAGMRRGDAGRAEGERSLECWREEMERESRGGGASAESLASAGASIEAPNEAGQEQSVERWRKGIEGVAAPRNLALANEGAFVVASSGFYGRPFDADYLLREPMWGGYASAYQAEEYFVEFDLGRAALIASIEIDWMNDDNYPTQVQIESSIVPEDQLALLFATHSNSSSSQVIDLESPTVLRRLKISVSKFRGEGRMLVRGLRVLGNPDRSRPYTPAPDEIDALDAKRGAIIGSASAFFPEPHDAAYLLRADDPPGYAAAHRDAEMPQWVEFGLGQPYEVRAVEIVWHSPKEFALDFELAVRALANEAWTPYASEQSNWKEISVIRREPMVARFVRLSATRFSQDQRLLIRAMHVWARDPS